MYIKAFKYFVLFLLFIAINAPHLWQQSPFILIFLSPFYFALLIASLAILDVSPPFIIKANVAIKMLC